MSSRFIQQQWKNVFISRSAAEAVSSDRKWALLIAPLVILANGCFYDDDDDDTLQRINKSCTNTLIYPHQCNRRQTVKCEALSQHRRINERPTTSSIEHKIGGVGNNTKCRHRSVMSSKYDVDFKTVLGEGAYGQVFRARLIETGETVALKKISKQYTDSSSFSRETDALLRVFENGGHPNISGLRDMYEDFGHYYLVLDLARGGEMFDQLIQHGQYSELDASRLVSEILSALAFLHNIGVVHHDLKPENILLCSELKGSQTIKIIDFGCASTDKRAREETIFSERYEQVNGKPSIQSIGTKAYWPPERFLPTNERVRDAADLWAVGVILFIMLVGSHPFDVTGLATDEEIERGIQERSPPMHLASHLSPSARDFIKSLMNPNPNERLTAITALQHPWIRGVTASSDAIEGSDTKLSMYQDLRDTLATAIFATLVDSEHLRSDNNKSMPQQSLTNLLKRAFQVFDEEGKGYVNENDVGRIVAKVTGTTMSRSDSKAMLHATKKESDTDGLSLSDFSQLFPQLSHQHYKRGENIYNPGDNGDRMFFINSGKVEILSKKGHLVATLRNGQFFGEGSLLENRNYRVTTARASTPVDLIAVGKEDFAKYFASGELVKQSLKLKHRERILAQAKQLIRLQTNFSKRKLSEGELVFEEGDIGRSMFLVDEGSLDARHGGKTLHHLEIGDSFGESSLLFSRPRSSSVICTSKVCGIYEMKGSDFLLLLQSDPEHAAALRDMCRKKMLQKAIKSSRFGDDVSRAFKAADKDQSGTLSLKEMKDLMLKLGTNSEIPEREIMALLKSLDTDDDGQVTLEDILESMKLFKE